jgi:hypothetical protein
MDNDLFLPGLPTDRIRAAYLAAPGNEMESGKFASPESSAALVANTFGLFLDQPTILPSLPGISELGWPARSVGLEVILRFPWSGGRHPCLDAVIVTGDALIGVESKRYEPFRPKSRSELSEAYWRRVWGSSMRGYERIRDGLRDGSCQFTRLDAAQLVKHAFGLRTAFHSDANFAGKKPVLFYLYAEPKVWPGTKGAVSIEDRAIHRKEIGQFASMVSEDEVAFRYCSYAELLATWRISTNPVVRSHAIAVVERFAP